MSPRDQWLRDQGREDLSGVATFWVLMVWLVAVVVLGMFAQCDDPAHASEVRPPPLIGEVQRVERPKPPVVALEARTHAEPIDGPMCSAERVEGPAPDQLGVLLEDPITDLERELVELSITRCLRRPGRIADPWQVLALYRLESSLGVPTEARGILAATWCLEGAMRDEAAKGGPLRGDWRDGRAMAHGPFQLWPWMRAWCGLVGAGADDLLVAATCYWQRVVERRDVRTLTCVHSWRVGEALAANGPRYMHEGCKAQSGHWREMRSWEVGR